MASSSWLPAQGSHQVSIGTSLRRALKARKANGDQPASSSSKRIPDRDFYAFRYNFKPNSIDTDKPGSIDIHKTTDSTLITVEYPSKQNGETHVFKGAENVAKEWDCVLVYDEELDTFTLEKLDSHAALTHERKPIAARPPPPPASPKPTKVKDDLEAQLERDLLDLADPDADAEGEDDLDEIIPKHITYRKEEEEEDPLEELLAPIQPPPPPKQQQLQRPPKTQTKAPAKEPQPPRADKPPAKAKGKAPAVPRPSSALPSVKPPAKPSTKPSTKPTAKPSAKPAVKPAVKPTPKPKQAPVPVPPPVATPAQAQAQTQAPTRSPAPTPTPAPPPPQAKAQTQTKAARKREPEPEPPHLSDADEEVLEFGKPAKRTRKMSSPPAPVSSGLALPGTSSFVAPPPAIPSASSSASSSSSRPLAAVATPQYALPSGSGGGGESESESEWSEVDPEAAIQGDDFFGDGVPEGDGDGGDNNNEEVVEMDDDALFEAELNQQMAEMEEDEQDEDEVGGTRGGPISLNDYARGVAGLSDDDSSTSEDSDDD